MKQKHALLLAFLITGLLASNLYLFSLINKPELETAIVARVIDADTLELSDGRKIRLLNINSPESILDQLPKLDSAIRQSIADLPTIKPAVKRGIFVNSQYRLVVIVKTL